MVIPVYNGEKYLPQCLDSVVKQPENSMEIIVVDDGSSDNTAAIINDYTGKDCRIVAISKENGGVSSARNAGINAARGNYIWFMDSDDRLVPNAVEVLKAAAGGAEYDIIMFTYCIVEKDDRVIPLRGTDFSHGCVFDHSNRDMVLKRLLSANLINVWRSIFRTDFIKYQQLSFDVTQRNAEDILFIYNAWLVCEKGIYINSPLYYYRKNPNSLTRTFHIDQYRNSQQARMVVFKGIEHLWPDNSDFKRLFVHRYIRFALKYMMSLFQKYEKHDKQSRRQSLSNILNDDLFQDFAQRVRGNEFGLIFGINLWLARRKMARTIWLFNTVINSGLARRINKVVGLKL